MEVGHLFDGERLACAVHDGPDGLCPLLELEGHLSLRTDVYVQVQGRLRFDFFGGLVLGTEPTDVSFFLFGSALGV